MRPPRPPPPPPRPPPPPIPCKGDTWKDPITKQVYECINGQYLTNKSGGCPSRLRNVEGVCIQGESPRNNWLEELSIAKKQNIELIDQLNKLTTEASQLNEINKVKENKIDVNNNIAMNNVKVAEGFGLRDDVNKAITQSIQDKQLIYNKISFQNNTLIRNMNKNTVSSQTEDQKNVYILQSIESYERWNRYLFVIYYMLFVICIYFTYMAGVLSLPVKVCIWVVLLIYPFAIYKVESMIYFLSSYISTLILNQTYEKEKIK